MNLATVTYDLVNLGIKQNQATEVSSRIRIINKFNLLCISYSIPYIILSLSLKCYQPASVFLIGLIVYLISLNCNKHAYFNTAKFLILFATNFSVFYLSFYYGFNSGFHLYYFTSPLIVFTLFSFEELNKIFFAFTIYLSSVAILIVLNHRGLLVNSAVSSNVQQLFYAINIFLALSFCILLVAYFSEFNSRVNLKLVNINDELKVKHELLEEEIIERRNTESKLHTLLNDKEILLSETHHRVKNNLAVVSGMLDLQALMYEDHQIRHILDDSRGRIKTMSLIHESLYKFDNLSHIEFGRYIRTLTEEIKKIHSENLCNVIINFNLEEIHLNVTEAIPCGLLVNEIVTNCFKHAFTGMSEGEISIELTQKNNNCSLIISDNGIGFDPDNINNSRSLGITLIEAFAKQLKGKYKFVNENGTKLILNFEN